MLVQSGHHIITMTYNVLKLSKEELPNARQSTSVTSMLHQLNWPTLADQRNQLKLMMMYKILHGLMHVQHSLPLTYSNLANAFCGHILTSLLNHTATRVDCYKFFFFTSMIRLKNSLPSSVVRAGSF